MSLQRCTTHQKPNITNLNTAETPSKAESQPRDLPLCPHHHRGGGRIPQPPSHPPPPTKHAKEPFRTDTKLTPQGLTTPRHLWAAPAGSTLSPRAAQYTQEGPYPP